MTEGNDIAKNTLYYGDNLDILRDHIASDSVVLITLERPSKQMNTETASAGFYAAPDGSKYPRLQILTVAELLQGKRVAYPPWSEDRTLRRAPKATEKRPRQDPLLPT